jgi:eukaryotic-like serine/threonine-protein kinase
MTEGHTERLEAALAGRYRIERKLGEGGMASVYLAEDLKHERKVALKILRPELAAVIGAERFLSEIKTTANLQHPHILPLFDSGSADGYLYYVMPYIEGETLRDKLDREKQLGVEESVRIARDVADALDYAHRHGVIHRDIKPANILMHDGRPVVADFGIALAVSAAGGGRMTETGLSLGTPHYMSPEQASADRDLSARSDVYSLGCVLYEMIAGQPPHTGPSAQSILVHILTKDPAPLTELRHTVPPNVAAAVAKSIEKLPADRFETAKEFRDALEDTGFAYATRPVGVERGLAASRDVAASTPVWRRNHKLTPLGASVTAAALFAALAAWGWLRQMPAPSVGVATRAVLPGVDLGGVAGWLLAVSPDGRWIVAGMQEERRATALYVRAADDPAWRRLPNTEGGGNPSFSPDGESIAFDAHGGISRVPLTGGPALPVAAPGFEPNWGFDGSIVYTAAGALYRVGSSGGGAELLFRSDTLTVSRPYLLPNGKGIVFGSGNTRGTSRIFVYEVETGEVRELVPAGNQPRYVSTGHLIYGHAAGALMAVPFDLETLRTTGPPVTVIPEVTVFSRGATQVAVSEGGTLVYATGTIVNGAASQELADRRLQLVEVDLSGAESPLPLDAGVMDTPRYSPNGRKIAYVDGPDIRVYDVVTGASPQVAVGDYPVWSTDGSYIYFSQDGTVSDGFRRPADGRAEAVQLWARPNGSYVRDVAPGDSLLVARENTPGRGHDLFLVRERGDSAEFEDFLTADWNEGNGEISPDGHWIAYQSDESGEYRVYVHSFPVITERYSVSPGLGADPVWSSDGRKLYYRSGTQFYAVAVATGPTFQVLSTPELLFDRPEYARYQNNGSVRTWDVRPDGTRFVMLKDASTGDGAASSSGVVYIVTNWFEELKARMGGR